MNAIIKTFRPESKLSKHHFFIQSRGLHSGRPLTKSIPNCFSIELQSKQEQEKYFYLVQGLYQAKKFQFHLVGSVIPLIRIGDVKAFDDNLFSEGSGTKHFCNNEGFLLFDSHFSPLHSQEEKCQLKYQMS
jgi:hypothetical protein